MNMKYKVVEKREESNDQKKGQNGDGDGAPKTVSAVFEEIQKKGTTSSFLAGDRNQYVSGFKFRIFQIQEGNNAIPCRNISSGVVR